MANDVGKGTNKVKSMPLGVITGAAMVRSSQVRGEPGGHGPGGGMRLMGEWDISTVASNLTALAESVLSLMKASGICIGYIH